MKKGRCGQKAKEELLHDAKRIVEAYKNLTVAMDQFLLDLSNYVRTDKTVKRRT